MPFLTNGATHYSGIKNEVGIVSYMNENPNNPINKHLEKKYNSKIISWKHIGGTKCVMDALVTFENLDELGISIKNHKNKTSTFDWINTTKYIDIELINEIKKFKETNTGLDIPAKGGIRSELSNILSTYQNNISSVLITDILNNIYTKEPNMKEILINDVTNKCLILIDKNNLDKYFNRENGHAFELKSSKKGSASKQIWINTDDGRNINTFLRIRICLNNGITALLGKSKANSNSSVCIKIQQDNVSKFISECHDKVYINY